MPGNYSKFSKAVIIGWNLKSFDFLKKSIKKTVSTSYGKTVYYQVKDCVFISRHSLKESIPPHRINHKANISTLKKIGVKYVFAFNSVGSLKKEIRPGSFVIPSDYIDFNPITFFETKAKFITPTLSNKIRKDFAKVLEKKKISFKNKGVYFHSKGPRFETKAEVNMIKNFADVVGMTMAKEATLANEIGLEYATLCTADNYAHGIGGNPLFEKEVERDRIKTRGKVEEIIKEILILKI